MSNNVIEATVEKLVPGGDGLARLDGCVVFIPGVLRGERIRARIIRTAKGWHRTGTPEILTESEDRREPFCPHVGRCGGCTWQHMAYEAQLKAKAGFVREALVRQGGISPENIPEFEVTPSPPEGYRCRIRPVITAPGESGFRAASSRMVVPLRYCPIATQGVNRFLESPPRSLDAGAQPIVFGNDSHYWVSGLHEEAQAMVKGRSFVFPPASFFQSNLKPLDALVEFVLGASGGFGGKTALDLYGGIGLFGAFLSHNFDHVVGVDKDEKAASAWLGHVGPKGEFHAESLEDWVRRDLSEKPDLILVDPPRTGLSLDVRKALNTISAPRLIYVSCNPVTQARDIKDLMASGYELASFGVFDFYPQTPHVETSALLIRSKSR